MPGESKLWSRFETGFKTRLDIIVLYLLVFAAPFVLLFLPSLLMKQKLPVSCTIAAISGLFVYFGFKDTLFPLGNIFTNMAVGAETFHEFWRPNSPRTESHYYSESFATLLTVARYFLSSVTIFFVLMQLAALRDLPRSVKVDPVVVLLLPMVFLYIFLLLITDTYFDRYHVPLTTLTLVLVIVISRTHKPFMPAAWFYLLPVVYLSVAGTRDYFTMNRQRWAAYDYLRKKLDIPLEKINGGYEINSWHEGEDFVWWDHIFLENHDYLIQYSAEPGFSVLRTYEFQRYFPVKKDKIYIFERNNKIVDQE